jgi:ribonuclease D
MSTAAKIGAELGYQFQALKNNMQLARWKLKWALQGGNTLWPARALTDKRNEEDLKRYRLIEFKRRHARRTNRVVNMVAWRYNRARRQTINRAG